MEADAEIFLFFYTQLFCLSTMVEDDEFSLVYINGFFYKNLVNI